MINTSISLHNILALMQQLAVCADTSPVGFAVQADMNAIVHRIGKRSRRGLWLVNRDLDGGNAELAAGSWKRMARATI
jgi:hypothetical protein